MNDAEKTQEQLIQELQEARQRISRMEKNEEKLRRSEAYYRMAVDASTGFVLRITPDGIRKFVNQAYCDYFNLAEEEAIGSSFLLQIAEQDHPHILETCASLTPDNPTKIDIYQSITLDGRVAWYEWTATGIFDDNAELIEIQLLGEQAQHESKQLGKVLDTLPVGVCLNDEAGFYRLMNDAYCAIYEYDREEMLGQHYSVIMPPDQIVLANQHYARLLSGDVGIPVERKRQRKDGSILYIEAANALVKDMNGQRMVITTVRDITERKEAEQQQFEFMLEREKTNILMNFIRDASHEFYTPLSVIGSNLYLLKRMGQDEKTLSRLDNVKKQTTYMEKLINDMMLMVRLDVLTEFIHSPVNLGSVLLDVTDQLQAHIKEKQLRLRLDLQTDLPFIQGNAKDLHVAMSKLVDNAIQYTLAEGHITIRAYTDEEGIVIKIEDTGIGINKEDISQIFSRFYRIDTARTIRGSGLGLSIVKKIVEIHKGKLKVESMPGQQTVFTVWFPHSI